MAPSPFIFSWPKQKTLKFFKCQRAEMGLRGKKAEKYFNKCHLSEARSVDAKSSNLHVLLKVK